MGDTEKMVVTIRNFPRDLHHKAKIQAAIEGISLKDLVVKALEQYLDAHYKERG